MSRLCMLCAVIIYKDAIQSVWDTLSASVASHCSRIAVGLLSRAEALSAAAAMQGDTPAQSKSQALSQDDISNVQQLLLQNTKVLAKLQEVLRKDNRDIAIMTNAQQNDSLSLMVT